MTILMILAVWAVFIALGLAFVHAATRNDVPDEIELMQGDEQ